MAPLWIKDSPQTLPVPPGGDDSVSTESSFQVKALILQHLRHHLLESKKDEQRLV